MTAVAILDLKQKLSKLSARERREMTSYLLRLKHESVEGRKEPHGGCVRWIREKKHDYLISRKR